MFRFFKTTKAPVPKTSIISQTEAIVKLSRAIIASYLNLQEELPRQLLKFANIFF